MEITESEFFYIPAVVTGTHIGSSPTHGFLTWYLYFDWHDSLKKDDRIVVGGHVLDANPRKAFSMGSLVAEVMRAFSWRSWENVKGADCYLVYKLDDVRLFKNKVTPKFQARPVGVVDLAYENEPFIFQKWHDRENKVKESESNE